MMRWLAAILCCVPLVAEISGTVKNGTSGKTQVATVTLIRLGQGMEVAGSTESAPDGSFRFAQEIAGPVLLQVAHQGVNYSQMFPPGRPRTGIELTIFDVNTDRANTKVTQHMILLEPTNGKLAVNETFLIENSGKTTVQDAQGAIRFTLPSAAAGKAQINATSPGSPMPLTRPAQAVGAADQYKIDFALKPGESKIDMGYEIPFQSGGQFQSRVLHDGGSVRLVTPKGVQLIGADVILAGQEPTTQANIYDLNGRTFDLKIEGQGELRSAMAEEENEGPEITAATPPIHDKRFWIMGLIGGILALTMFRYLNMSAAT
jgi:hypothetical protein